MKEFKVFLISILIFFAATNLFAQNVKPYQIDLNKMPAANNDKTVTFDKATKTVTVKKRDTSIFLWLNNLDITDYNIVRIKYKSSDYGFHFVLEYNSENLEWYERCTYCPTYLNEMIIPLKDNQKRLNGITISGTWQVQYEQFIIESITLEKVENPQKTDLYALDEPPVIDTATNVTINDKLNAWDFVPQLGAGLQYMAVFASPAVIDFGLDIYPGSGFKKASKEQIQCIKNKGFKTIRLQTNPDIGYIMDKNYTISPQYIRYIKQVVDLCIEEDMYVIVCGPFAEFVTNPDFIKRIESGNIHWGAYYLNEKDKKESEKFLKAIWKQFAEAFNNSYDEHLIFETLNEPVDMKHEHSWRPKDNCTTCKKDFAILNDYNQLIVDTIRSTGGNNANRFIVIEGIAGGCKNITTELFKLPKDKAKNKLIPTFHYYPMGANTLEPKNYYTDFMKKDINEIFIALDKTYFSKHIPVLVGEIGHMRFSPILERINSIKDFMEEVTKSGRSCAAILHIDGDMTGEYNYFGYYDSWNLKWHDIEYVDTFIYGAQGKEYPLSADFIKKNEVKIESIVGKNLLTEPYKLKNWNAYQIQSITFYRSTPEKYKLVIELEKTGSEPVLEIAYDDFDLNWHNGVNTASLKNIKVKGGTFDGNIKVKDNIVEISINEKLASELANSNHVYINGKDILLKSVKVME